MKLGYFPIEVCTIPEKFITMLIPIILSKTRTLGISVLLINYKRIVQPVLSSPYLFKTTAIVLAMHSKGTFTSSEANDYLRDVLMKAITSDECVGMPDSGACSSCSSKFSQFPFSHYAGNMWVSDCDYVRKLIPPKDFEKAKQNLVDAMMNATTEVPQEELSPKEIFDESRFFKVTLGDGIKPFRYQKSVEWQHSRVSWLGTGRYAMEHWLGSHPDFKPCEVFGTKDVGQYVRLEGPLEKVSELTANISYSESFTKAARSNQNEQDFFSPWFKLEGRIYSFRALYKKVPAKSSWIYNLFGNLEDDEHEQVAVSTPS